jgi:AcrR family transcriptional regulator
MDRISERAGASKRTVYKHFESKQHLFQELVRQHWSRFADTLEVTYDEARDIREQLTEVGLAQGKLFTSPDIMATTRLVMSELLRSPELVEENQSKTDYKIYLEAMLREAMADGQLQDADPQEAAEEFISLLKGKAFWPVILGAPVATEEEMQRIVQSSVTLLMSRYGSATQDG